MRVSFFNLPSRRKAQQIEKRMRNKLTYEMKIDNLEKFAKTSLAAEVILDRPVKSKDKAAKK
jgi:hypothetical protein